MAELVASHTMFRLLVSYHADMLWLLHAVIRNQIS